MNNIINTLNSINSFSQKVIFYGCSVVIIAVVTSICMIAVNSTFIHEPEIYDIATKILQKFTVVFAQVIIGALIMDWFSKINFDD